MLYLSATLPAILFSCCLLSCDFFQQQPFLQLPSQLLLFQRQLFYHQQFNSVLAHVCNVCISVQSLHQCAMTAPVCNFSTSAQ